MIPLMFVIIYNNIYNGSAYVFWYSAINVYMDILRDINTHENSELLYF